MGRVCTICSHDERFEIEAAICDGKPNTRIAAKHNVKEQAIRYHRKEGHLSKRLAQAVASEEIAHADSLLDRIEALHARTLAILEATEGTEDHRTALTAIREARSNLELIGEITKELDRTPTLNLSMNPEWIELRTVIVKAVEPHAEARDALSAALLELEAGNGLG